MMDRSLALTILGSMMESESLARDKERSYLSHVEQRRARERHGENVEAIQYAIQVLDTLEGPIEAISCPTPSCESDEYVCRACWIRWDIREEKPPCQRNR